MGDIADEHANQMMEFGMWGWLPRRAYGPRVSCKFCGAHNVYWQRTREGWQLNNKDNLERHLCRQPEQPNAEGFDDVD